MKGIDRQSGGQDPLRKLKSAQRELRHSQEGRAEAERTLSNDRAEFRRNERMEAELQASTTGKKLTGSIQSTSRDSISVTAPALEADPKRESHVAALKAAFKSGTLNTPARIEKAAEGLLAGKS